VNCTLLDIAPALKQMGSGHGTGPVEFVLKVTFAAYAISSKTHEA
jgi:hypothetical protein